jgi:hypothetical protein
MPYRAVLPCSQTLAKNAVFPPTGDPPDMNLWSRFSFLLDSTATGLVTWVGTILTIIGLWITFREARKSREAAQAARESVGKLEHRIAAANVTHASAQISIVNDLIANSEFATAKILFSLTKRSLIHTCRILEKLDKDDPLIEQIKKNMRAIETQLDRATGSTHKQSILDKAINGMNEALLIVESILIFPEA